MITRSPHLITPLPATGIPQFICLQLRSGLALITAIFQVLCALYGHIVVHRVRREKADASKTMCAVKYHIQDADVCTVPSNECQDR